MIIGKETRNRRKNKRKKDKVVGRKGRQEEAKTAKSVRVRTKVVAREVIEHLFNSLLRMGGKSAVLQHRLVPESTLVIIHPRLHNYANVYWAKLLRAFGADIITKELNTSSIMKAGL